MFVLYWGITLAIILAFSASHCIQRGRNLTATTFNELIDLFTSFFLVDDILNIVFGWFELIKAEGPQRFHCARIANFYGKVYGGPLKRDNAAGRASEVAKQMQFYPLPDRFTAGFLLDRYRPPVLHALFAAVCAEKAVCCLCHSRAGPFFDKEESVYHVQYREESLTDRLASVEEQIALAKLCGVKFPSIPSATTLTGDVARFESPQPAEYAVDGDDFKVDFEKEVTLAMPQYIHRDFREDLVIGNKVFPEEGMRFVSEEGRAKVTLSVRSRWFWVTDTFRPPVLIKYTPKVMLWVKQAAGHSGRSWMTFQVHSPWVIGSVKNSLITALYLKCVSRKLQKFSNKAFLQGANFELLPSATGFRVQISTNTYAKCSLKSVVSEILKALCSESVLQNSEILEHVKSENPREVADDDPSLLERLLNLKVWLLLDPGPPDALKFLDLIKQVRFRDVVTCFRELLKGCRTHIVISVRRRLCSITSHIFSLVANVADLLQYITGKLPAFTCTATLQESRSSIFAR